jgi:hypothetical protein
MSILSCRHGMTSFFTRPKHGPWHSDTFSCRVGPSTTLAIWLLRPYENTTLLCYELSLSQFCTCKEDFVIYLYDTNYTKLYNAYNEWLTWYNLQICYSTIFMSRRSKHGLEYVLCCFIRRDEILGTSRPSHSCRVGTVQNLSCRVKMSYFVRPTDSATQVCI